MRCNKRPAFNFIFFYLSVSIHLCQQSLLKIIIIADHVIATRRIPVPYVSRTTHAAMESMIALPWKRLLDGNKLP